MSKNQVGLEGRSYKDRWTHSGNKFVIGTIHGTPIEIIAQYNPKEVARQAAATWNPHQNTSAKYAPNGESRMWSEYGTTAPRTVTVELLFDGYEEGSSVAPIVESLERLTIPVDMGSRDPTERRPQLCVAVWGAQQLRCVVTTVATKLTMFDSSGTPLRATCTVTLTEVDVVAMMQTDVHSAIDRVARSSGNTASTTPRHDFPYPPEDSKPTRVPTPSRSQPTPAASAPSTPAPKPAAAAPAATPAQTGTPSKKINPAALDGAGPLFEDDPPAPASSVGTPSKKINPAALDGTQPGTGPLFEDDPPAPDAVSGADSGTADPKYKAASEDMV